MDDYSPSVYRFAWKQMMGEDQIILIVNINLYLIGVCDENTHDLPGIP